MSLRRTARRALVALLALAGALLAAELGLRLSGYEPLHEPSGPRHMFREDAVLGLALVPGFRGAHRHPEFEVPVEVSAQGLRDREYGEKPPGAFRVLSLGDSFAFGYGVRPEECYAKRLQALLLERGDGTRYEVVNAGVPGYSTRQMLAQLERLAGAIEPDVVLFTFLFVDDLPSNLAPPNRVRGGLVLTPYFADAVDRSPLARFAVNRSQLALCAYAGWLEWRHGVSLGMPASSERPPDAVLPPVGLHLLAASPAPELEEEWRVAAELLGAIAARARASGATPVLLDVSLPFQHDDELWKRTLEQHPEIDPAAVDRSAVARRLGELCAAHGVVLVELGDAPAELRLGERDYYFHNQHFTAQGHDKVARILALELEESGLLQGG